MSSHAASHSGGGLGGSPAVASGDRETMPLSLVGSHRGKSGAEARASPARSKRLESRL